MTAEIAILNKAAVALAADSTVTVGGADGTKRAKTYQSANKLFTLSKHHPVGVMIYGNAGLMDVPWETIIKEYRKQLSVRGFGTVNGYAADFIRYLERSKNIFNEQLQRSWFAMSVHSYFLGRLLPLVNDAVKQSIGKGTATAAQIGAIASKVIQDHWASDLSKIRVIPKLSGKFEEGIIKTHAKEVALATGEVFKSMPLSPDAIKDLNRSAARVICGEIFPDPLMSGVVMAGFGMEQIFPEVQTFSPQCITKNRLIFRRETDESYAITHDHGAALIPFAQKDVVDTFLRGIDRRYLRIVNEALSKLSTDYPAIVAQHFGATDPAKTSAIASKLAVETQKLADALRQKLEEHRDKNHVNPLLAVIGTLPKNELAEMAEALVSLTSLKRKMSNDLETVGGPIDVAVISKGDGFIWIRRKHYFKPELNPHFIRSYLREYGCGKRKQKA
jgi:hypothetical protein